MFANTKRPLQSPCGFVCGNNLMCERTNNYAPSWRKEEAISPHESGHGTRSDCVPFQFEETAPKVVRKNILGNALLRNGYRF
jgi:hypothetical protein